MSILTLHIKYNYGSERIRFDPQNPHKTGDIIQADGYWPDQDITAPYSQKVTHHIEEDGTHVLRLESSPELNRDVDPDLTFYWGSVVIRLQPDLNTATAEWIATDPRTDVEDGSIGCIILTESDERVIEYEATVRIKRNQDRLRRELLKVDRKCVITGETTVQALQAAHIVDVAQNGLDEMANVVLMRADLHALFDRNVFTFTANGSVQILDNDGLSDAYQKLFEGAKVDGVVIDRIGLNLARRNEAKDL